MPTTGFVLLPCELLEAIADNLDAEDLDSFTLLNRACYSALVPRSFSSIAFRIDERDALKPDATNLVRALERDDAFKHVRTLEIFGEWRRDDNPLVKFAGKYECQPWVTNHYVAGKDGERVDLRWQADFEPASKTYEDDTSWQPLASLLDRLPRLEDLIYECPHQFPPCLLEKLHSQLPNCRLHIRCFRLRCLLDNNELDGYERELITSANLTTIFASFELFYEDYFADFGYRTIVKVASGIAPNLKEVRVNNFATSDACARRARRSDFRPTPRKHVLPGKVSSKGALEVLELHGYEDGRGPIDLPCLELWHFATDLSRLRLLRLGGVEEEVLQWMTDKRPFRDLTALAFCPRATYNPRPHHAPRSTYNLRLHHATIPAFLNSLPPLKDLEMIGEFCKHDLDAVVAASACLHRLHVRHPFQKSGRSPPNQILRDKRSSCFLPSQILRLREECPQVTDLRVTMRVFTTSQEEEEAYEALGGFTMRSRPFLTFLRLDRQDLELLGEHLARSAETEHRKGWKTYLDAGSR